MSSKPLTYGAAAIVVAAAIGWYLLAGPGGSGIDSADAGDPALVALGRIVYTEKCAACHGADLRGQPDWRSPLPAGGRPAPPHDETGHTWHHPDQLLFDITKAGGAEFSPSGYSNNMPGFGDSLVDREIWAALAYIKSRWPEPIRDRQARIDDRNRER